MDSRGWCLVVALFNSAEGGTSGTAYSAANTGGTSGTAFDTVTTGAVGTFDNAHAMHGSLAYLHSSTTSASFFGEWNTAATIGSLPTMWGRLYLYMTANPAATLNIARWLGPAGAQSGRISIGTTGKIFYTNNTGSANLQSTVSIGLNAWERIEWSCTPTSGAATGTGELRHYVGDSATLVETAQTITAQAFGAANIQGVRFGIAGATASVVNFWLDDLAVSDSDWIGSALAGPTQAAGTDNSSALLGMRL